MTTPEHLQAQRDHDAAKAKLASLEKKILVGGENLLEKAEEQEKLLEDSARQLEETVRSEAAIRKALKGLVTNNVLLFTFSKQIMLYLSQNNSKSFQNAWESYLGRFNFFQLEGIQYPPPLQRPPELSPKLYTL